VETEATVRLLGHRQTKEAATDKPNLPPPRHVPTLPSEKVARTVHLEKAEPTLCRVMGRTTGRQVRTKEHSSMRISAIADGITSSPG
jgi:hypothetical protein